MTYWDREPWPFVDERPRAERVASALLIGLLKAWAWLHRLVRRAL